MMITADRYLDPGDAGELALELYEGVARRPIVSPHGHVDVELLVDPEARLPAPGRLFVEHFHLFKGTPTGLWTRETLAAVFGVDRALDAGSADIVYDELEHQLAS